MFMAAALMAYPVWRTLAAAGDLDTSFSGDGRYTLPLAFPASNTGYATNVDDVLIQTDPNNPTVEKIIAAYSEDRASFLVPNVGYDFLVTRLHPSGTKDSSFGNDGYAVVDFESIGLPTQVSTVTALAQQSNGKILVAGTLYNSQIPIAGLARLTLNGDLDTSFSGDGMWFYLGSSEVSDVIVQSDGKILLAGKMKDSTNTYWKSALWRFNSNGTPDASFGTSGYLHTTVWFGSSTDGGVREGFKSAYVQSDGKIVVLNNNGSGYRLRRFTASGAIDSTLIVNAPTGERGNAVTGVSSKIWVVGSKEQQGVKYGAIFSRTSTGGLDTAFGNGTGYVLAAQASEWTDFAHVPFSFPSKYVIAGWNKYTGQGSYAVITRYSATGSLDTTFGTNGSTETAGFDGYPHSRYSCIRIGLSGKIVTGGQAGQFDSIAGLPFPTGVVARYWGN
jgi:uncharacterized delta-60 repeat protein